MRIGILCAGDTELEPFLACMEVKAAWPGVSRKVMD